MNRGLLFYQPTVSEWVEYNAKVLNNTDFTLENQQPNSKSGVYLLASYMPALSLRLTEPDLNWCVDVDLLERNETKISIGSSYFVMDRCVIGPTMHYMDASLDRRVNTYVESFANEVSNGLRWILQTYRTTNLLQQFDLFNMDLAVGRNIHNKQAFGNYTPVQLIIEPRKSPDCEVVPMCTGLDQPYYVQPFGYSSGATAPIGSVGQFTRPHLGSAMITGVCSSNSNNQGFSDPFMLNANDSRRLNEYMGRNHDIMTNQHPNIFQPSSGIGPMRETMEHSTDNSAATRTTANTTSVISQDSMNQVIPHYDAIPHQSGVSPAVGIPQPPLQPQVPSEWNSSEQIQSTDVDMGGLDSQPPNAMEVMNHLLNQV